MDYDKTIITDKGVYDWEIGEKVSPLLDNKAYKVSNIIEFGEGRIEYNLTAI